MDRRCGIGVFWLALEVGGCGREPIKWHEPTPLPAELTTSTEMAFDLRQQLVSLHPPTIPEPVFVGECAGSVQLSRDTLGAWYAAWWSVRSDSTAEIVVSRSSDGETWATPVRVDSTDAGRTGCRRPPPSIKALGDNVHVAYAMAAKEGPGIFAAHSMDRGMTFHSPVAVVYGEHVGLTAIAARGDLVAVAYEDPNSDPQRVAVALSRTMGHAFEAHEIVSPSTGEAHAPSIALGDDRIAVTWVHGDPATASVSRAIRIGELR